MRIFSLATDEAVVVGGEIVVKVLEIDGDKVRLGIEHSEEVILESGGPQTALGLEPVP